MHITSTLAIVIPVSNLPVFSSDFVIFEPGTDRVNYVDDEGSYTFNYEALNNSATSPGHNSFDITSI